MTRRSALKVRKSVRTQSKASREEAYVVHRFHCSALKLAIPVPNRTAGGKVLVLIPKATEAGLSSSRERHANTVADAGRPVVGDQRSRTSKHKAINIKLNADSHPYLQAETIPAFSL